MEASGQKSGSGDENENFTYRSELQTWEPQIGFGEEGDLTVPGRAQIKFGGGIRLCLAEPRSDLGVGI